MHFVAVTESKITMIKRSPVLLGQKRSHLFDRAFGYPLRISSKTVRVVKTAAMKLFRQSDYNRWEDPGSCLAWWATRTERIAKLVPEGSRVLEFGAGNRQLEYLLSASCTYVPSDLIDRGPGTVICDLNKKPLPDLRGLTADVAVFAGVLEYIDDLPFLIEWLSSQVVFCVLSYECLSSNPHSLRRIGEILHRASHGYMSYFTEKQLIALFEGNGFACTRTETWRDQGLFLFVKSQ